MSINLPNLTKKVGVIGTSNASTQCAHVVTISPSRSNDEMFLK